MTAVLGRIWNFVRLLVHARGRQRKGGYFDTASIDGVAILSARSFPNPDLGSLRFTITDPATIAALFAEVDFSHYVDGRELGVDHDAYVFIRRPYGISKLIICGDYTYLLPDNAWTELHRLTAEGDRLFRQHTTV